MRFGSREAERRLSRISRGDPSGYRRLVDSIKALGHDPRPRGAVRLTGVDPPAWRIRVGNYRIVYEVRDEELVVLVLNAAPRGEVYR